MLDILGAALIVAGFAVVFGLGAALLAGGVASLAISWGITQAAARRKATS